MPFIKSTLKCNKIKTCVDSRCVIRYKKKIKSFAHKGLEKFFMTGNKAGIRADNARKLARQLAMLNIATDPKAMDVPGCRLHKLSTGHWSIWVNGNWRITFIFEDEDAQIVDYQDYH